MITILLAPSETKSDGGVDNPISSGSFVFDNLYDKRMYIIDKYNEYIVNSSVEELRDFFELKKDSDILKYKENILHKPTKKAVLRYTGVAYDNIDYISLDKNSQQYIDDNVIIFSNLFGTIKASDMIPDYKYKQGAKLQDINVEKFYKDNFSNAIDEYLSDCVIDLRAKYYEKFYEIKKEYLTFTFLKDNKIVSHFAKKYRGIILKELALHNAQTCDDVLSINFDMLKLKEIKKIKNKKEIVFDII